MNIQSESKKKLTISSPVNQQGAVLVISLIMLFLTSIIGFQSMQTSTIHEKMTSNSIDRLKAVQAADAAVRFGVTQLNSTNALTLTGFVDNMSDAGAYDLRQTGTMSLTTGTKGFTDWMSMRSVSAWPWGDSTKRSEITNHIDSGNSMELAIKPQFAIGMQESILRKGSENYYCIPLTIIGAGQGTSDTTRVLIEAKIIPKSGCFRATVNR